MWLVAALLVTALALSWREKGPVWALALGWLFCLAPILFGWVSYGFFEPQAGWYTAATLAALGSYLAGAALWHLLPRRALEAPSEAAAANDFAFGYSCAVLAWWAGVAGVACISLDFAISGGAGLDDLAALRNAVVERTSATLLAQIGSVLTWGCLYCFIFGLVFRARLSTAALIRMLVPICGYFLLSVFSAGRQAAFQIMLVTLFAVAMIRARQPRKVVARARRSPAATIAVMSVAALMIAYMGYVAVARNDNIINDDKAEVILTLFEAQVSPGADNALSAFGPGVRSAAVEGIVYFSSPIALFQKYLTIKFPDLSLGGLTFPFVFRQLQGLTEISPSDALAEKMVRLGGTGVIGAGWTTAISSFLGDFGVVGTGLFLFALGYYSVSAWQRARVSTNQSDVVVAMVLLLAAVYMPLLPAVSDTNIFMLWLFAVVTNWLRSAPRHMTAADTRSTTLPRPTT